MSAINDARKNAIRRLSHLVWNADYDEFKTFYPEERFKVPSGYSENPYLKKEFSSMREDPLTWFDKLDEDRKDRVLKHALDCYS